MVASAQQYGKDMKTWWLEQVFTSEILTSDYVKDFLTSYDKGEKGRKNKDVSFDVLTLLENVVDAAFTLLPGVSPVIKSVWVLTKEIVNTAATQKAKGRAVPSHNPGRLDSTFGELGADLNNKMEETSIYLDANIETICSNFGYLKQYYSVRNNSTNGLNYTSTDLDLGAEAIVKSFKKQIYIIGARVSFSLMLCSVITVYSPGVYPPQ